MHETDPAERGVTVEVTTEGYSDGAILDWYVYDEFGDRPGEDFEGGETRGTVTINNNQGSFTIIAVEDFDAEGTEVYTVAVSDIVDQVTKELQFNIAEERQYTVTITPNALSEGGTAVVEVNTVNVKDGTNVPYTITGVNNLDIDVPLTGTVTINQIAPALGVGFVTIEISEDGILDGQETLTFDVFGNSDSVTITDTSTALPGGGGGGGGGGSTATYTINADQDIIYENLFTPRESTITITTTNVPENTVLSWTIGGTGITTGDYVVDGEIPTTLTGTVTLDSLGSASVTLSAVNDLVLEGQGYEDLTFTLDGTGQYAS